MTPYLFGEEPPSAAEGFEEFYKNYPKKVAKEDAQRAWNKLQPGPELRTEINEAVKLQTQHNWKDKKFIPHPATFLNGKRWKDEIDYGTKRINAPANNGRYEKYVKRAGPSE